MKIFCISIPTLKFLKLSSTYEVEDCLQDCSLKIHAPGLVSLLCQSNVPKEFILSTPALVEAEVAVLLNDYYVPTTEQRIGDAETISRFLRALTHVRRLSVSERTLQLLFFADNKLKNLPTFHNVKQLTITEEVDSHELFIALLKATPNLESLVFDNLVTTSYPARKVDMVNIGCLFSRLKFICFRQFIGKPREMKLVKLILKNAKHLQTMIISYGAETSICMDDRKSKEELMVEVPNIPRASSSCLFKFSSFFLLFCMTMN